MLLPIRNFFSSLTNEENVRGKNRFKGKSVEHICIKAINNAVWNLLIDKKLSHNLKCNKI